MNAIYTRVIVDELGKVQEYASDLTGAEINEILESHPEWKLVTERLAVCYYSNIEYTDEF